MISCRIVSLVKIIFAILSWLTIFGKLQMAYRIGRSKKNKYVLFLSYRYSYVKQFRSETRRKTRLKFCKAMALILILYVSEHGYRGRIFNIHQSAEIGSKDIH